MRRGCLWVAASLMVLSGDVRANGQISHLRITDDGVAQLPDCDLHEFLDDPAVRDMLDNGTMYPDGGYGPVNHEDSRTAAETAHWEPFQNAYREWILATYGDPLSPEAAPHVAFYLGLSSHGMADQVFDSLYGERVRRFDPSDLGDLDQYMEYTMVDARGPWTPPPDWVPYDTFGELYLDVVGLSYPEESMAMGQNLLRIAINGLNLLGEQPENVQLAADTYPWGAANLLDPDVAGSPPYEAQIIPRYWIVNWDLLHGQELRAPVMWTRPSDGGAMHPTDSTSIESWITMVFVRGIEESALSPTQFTIETEAGGSIPFDLDLYYGNTSHVVHLQPTADLEPDQTYTVSVAAGVETIHGELLEPFSFRFATGSGAPDPINELGVWDTCDVPLVPGETETDTGGSSDSGTGDTGSGETEGQDEASSGCGCRTSSHPLFALVMLLGFRGWSRLRSRTRPA